MLWKQAVCDNGQTQGHVCANKTLFRHQNLDFIYFQMLQTSLLLTFKISFTYGFSNSHVWMWKLHHKEGWALKNWCFWTVMLKKTLESPLDSKDIKKVILKEINWIFIGSTDAEAEVPILWPPDAESQLIRKDPDAGKDWRQEEKLGQGMRWLDSISYSMDMGLSKLQACCSPWGHKELDPT